jgi:group I intron endonuclease
VSCIYKIIVRRTDKPDLIYIGQAKDFDRRRRDHLKALRGSRHDNPRLQNLFSKHGAAAFCFEQILICSPDMATRYEQAILDFYIREVGRDVLNIHRKCVTSSCGVKRSAAVRAKISAAKKGKPGRRWTEEEKAKVSATKKGIKLRPEQVEAHRIAMTGRCASEKTRAKMSRSQKLRTDTEETKAKKRDAALLRNQSSEYRSKLRIALTGNKNALGNKHSPEARRKMSIAALHRNVSIPST